MPHYRKSDAIIHTPVPMMNMALICLFVKAIAGVRLVGALLAAPIRVRVALNSGDAASSAHTGKDSVELRGRSKQRPYEHPPIMSHTRILGGGCDR